MTFSRNPLGNRRHRSARQPAASTSPLSPSPLDADVDGETEELEVCAARGTDCPGAPSRKVLLLHQPEATRRAYAEEYGIPLRELGLEPDPDADAAQIASGCLPGIR
jgi:hypothetical protein